MLRPRWPSGRTRWRLPGDRQACSAGVLQNISNTILPMQHLLGPDRALRLLATPRRSAGKPEAAKLHGAQQGAAHAPRTPLPMPLPAPPKHATCCSRACTASRPPVRDAGALRKPFDETQNEPADTLARPGLYRLFALGARVKAGQAATRRPPPTAGSPRTHTHATLEQQGGASRARPPAAVVGRGRPAKSRMRLSVVVPGPQLK